MEDVVTWVVRRLREIVAEWERECTEITNEFAAGLRIWLAETWPKIPPEDWRPKWQAFEREWTARGVDIEQADGLFRRLTNRERVLTQAAAHNGAAHRVLDTAPHTGNSPFQTEVEHAAVQHSLDGFFEGVEARSEQSRRADESADEQRPTEGALIKRRYILGILGSDLQNIPLSAVNRLRREGLFTEETSPGGLNNLQPRVVIELPGADGGTETIVLEFVRPWLSAAHWRVVSVTTGATAAAVVAAIDRAEAQRHSDVMRVRGSIVQAQMAVNEILASGGSWPLILQGLDQLQTASRNLSSDQPRDSAIAATAAAFYEHKLGMTPDEAKRAGERFDQLLPLIAGVGEVGLNTIRERVTRPPTGRGVWDEGPQPRGNILERRHGGHLPYTAFQGEAERIAQQASGSRGLTPNATAAAMRKVDVDISSLSPPATRPFADPEKVQRLGAFDWTKYSPIEVDKVGDRLIIQNGMTRVEAARRAGIKKLPAYVFEDN